MISAADDAHTSVDGGNVGSRKSVMMVSVIGIVGEIVSVGVESVGVIASVGVGGVVYVTISVGFPLDASFDRITKISRPEDVIARDKNCPFSSFTLFVIKIFLLLLFIN